MLLSDALNHDSLPRDTPVLPVSLPQRTDTVPTLTVLTGVHAGQLVAFRGAAMTIGRAADADLVVEDAGVSSHHVRLARMADGAYYAEDLGSTNGTFLGTTRIAVALLREGDRLQLGPQFQVRFSMTDAVEESLYRRLYETSVHDPLTHVFNRRYLDDRLLADLAQARRGKGEGVLLMIDVDGLKQVNDTFGHLAGDRALCTIAARIQRVLRAGDVLSRYGGDEFVVLAVAAARADATELAERVRRAIEGLNMSARGREVRITISVGVAWLAETEGGDGAAAALLALADARMYAAKSEGGNRVCVVGPPLGEPAPALRLSSSRAVGASYGRPSVRPR